MEEKRNDLIDKRNGAQSNKGECDCRENFTQKGVNETLACLCAGGNNGRGSRAGTQAWRSSLGSCLATDFV